MTVKKALHIYMRSYYVTDTVPGTGTIEASKTESLLTLKSSYANRRKGLFNMLIT